MHAHLASYIALLNINSHIHGYICLAATCFQFNLPISVCIFNTGLILQINQLARPPGILPVLPTARLGRQIGLLTTRFPNDFVFYSLSCGQHLPSTGSMPCPFLLPFLFSYMPQPTHTLRVNNLMFYGSGSQINIIRLSDGLKNM